MQNILQTVSIYWEASIFISDNGILTLSSFLKTMRVLGYQDQIFNRHSLPLGIRKMPWRIF